uniref:RxLR effector protein n=1 Tax=Peronospora matthiolae TaxID=2874970 RepID=A0AAV1V1M4_9STRA
MRLHYVAHVIAAALAASAYGLQAVPDAVNLSPLQTSTEAQHQTNVAEKTERFLVSDDKDLPLMVTLAEPLLSAQQERHAARQLRAYDNDDDDDDWEKRHHRKDKKKGKSGEVKDWRKENRLRQRKKWNAQKKKHADQQKKNWLKQKKKLDHKNWLKQKKKLDHKNWLKQKKKLDHKNWLKQKKKLDHKNWLKQKKKLEEMKRREAYKNGGHAN